MTLESSHYKPPDQEMLESKALKFVRQNDPKEYRRMKKEGELEKFCQLKAEAAKSYAESLIATGEFENQAWYRAICLEILEREKD
jgi:hypothetical protein